MRRVIFFFCLATSVFAFGCKSTYREPISDPAIQHSVEIARITEAITSYGNTVDVLTTDLTSGASELGKSLDDLSILLEQYFDRVEIMLQRYKYLKRYVNEGTYKEFHFDEVVNSWDTLDTYPDNR